MSFSYKVNGHVIVKIFVQDEWVVSSKKPTTEDIALLTFDEVTENFEKCELISYLLEIKEEC